MIAPFGTRVAQANQQFVWEGHQGANALQEFMDDEYRAEAKKRYGTLFPRPLRLLDS